MKFKAGEIKCYKEKKITPPPNEWRNIPICNKALLKPVYLSMKTHWPNVWVRLVLYPIHLIFIMISQASSCAIIMLHVILLVLNNLFSPKQSARILISISIF